MDLTSGMIVNFQGLKRLGVTPEKNPALARHKDHMTTGLQLQGPLGKRHNAISQITQTQEPSGNDAMHLYHI